MSTKFYYARVMGAAGWCTLAEYRHSYRETRYFKTLAAAKAAATRVMRNIGCADVPGAGAQVYEFESGAVDRAYRVASRGYFTEWREE